jgi:hypothetical protein
MGWQGGRVQEWYKSIHFGVWGGMEIVMLLLVGPFWRMRGKVAANKNDISPTILAYGWHGGSLQEWHKSIHFGVLGDMEAVKF